jgi:hypothetical protein
MTYQDVVDFVREKLESVSFSSHLFCLSCYSNMNDATFTGHK